MSSDDKGGKYALGTGRKKADTEQAFAVRPGKDDSGHGVPPVPTGKYALATGRKKADAEQAFGVIQGKGAGVLGIHAPSPNT